MASELAVANNPIRVAVVDSEMGGLTCISRLIQLYGAENVKGVVYDRHKRIGGIIQTDTHGDVGPMFVHKKRHTHLTELMRWWVEGVDNFEQFYFIGDNEPLYPEDESYAASSGVTRYFGRKGELDSAEVDAGLDVLRSSYIPAICAKLRFDRFDPTELDPLYEAIQLMSVEQWLNGQSVPGLEELPLPDISAAALDSFRWMLEHDNGVPLWEQNLLSLFLMFYANGVGYYCGGTEIVRGGGSTVIRYAHQKLLKEGVEFKLNCRAQLRDPNEPVLYFEDGSSREFDLVIVGSAPTVHDDCLFDPDFQMGRALFWNIRLESQFAKQITEWDTYAPFGETWQSMTHRDTLVFFAGGRGYDDSCDAPPFEKLEAAFPGISRHVVLHHTVDWVQDPLRGGAFSFPKPGKFGAISRARKRAKDQKRVVVVGEWVSDEVGYPGAAARVAFETLEDLRPTLDAIVNA